MCLATGLSLTTTPIAFLSLSVIRRRLTVGDRTVDVEKSPHEVIWNSAQTHVGENTGTTDTDVIFVELK
jgi:hypothetical protein